MARINVAWRITDPARTGHGTVLRHRHGCRCRPCRAAWANYCKGARRRVRKSTADFVVSPDLAIKHLNELTKSGVGLRAVARVTGISREHLQDIRNGRRRIRQSTEQRILRLTPCAVMEATLTAKASERADKRQALLDKIILLKRRQAYLKRGAA